MLFWLLLCLGFLSLFAVGCGFVLGYHWRELQIKMHILTEKMAGLQKRQDSIAPAPQPSARLLDPDDIVARAKWEHDERLRKLNGGQ